MDRTHGGLTGPVIAVLIGVIGVVAFWRSMPIAEAPLLLAGGLFAIVIAIRWPLVPALASLAFIGFRVQEAFPVLYPFQLPFLSFAWTTLALAVALLMGRTRPYGTPQLAFLGGVIVVSLVSMVFGLDFGRSWDFWSDRYVKVLMLAYALSLLIRRDEDFVLTLRALCLFGALIAGVAINNAAEGIGFVEETRITIGKALGSPLGDPNDLALFLSIPLSFAIAATLLATNRFDRAFGFCTAGLTGYAILLTQSRGGLIGMLCMFAIFGLYLVKSRALLILALVVGAPVLYAAMGISGRVSGGAAEAGLGEAADIRIQLWWIGLRTILSDPLTGVGVANFPIIAAIYTGIGWVTHNTWLEVAVESGLIGFALFMGLLATSIRSAMGSIDHSTTHRDAAILRVFGFAVLGAIAAFVGAATFISHAYTWVIYVLAAITMALQHRIGEVDREIRAEPRRTRRRPVEASKPALGASGMQP